MVIGWRNRREDGFARVVTTKVLKAVIRLTLGVWIKDANTPFRLMKASVLREDLPLVPEHFFLSNVLLSVIFTRKGRKIQYIPITFRTRQGGVNSINIRRIIKIGKAAWRDFKRLNRELPNKNTQEM